MIGAALNLGQTIMAALRRTNPNDKKINEDYDFLKGMNTTYNLLTSNNLNKITGATIVNPLIVLDRDIVNEEYMNDLMQIIQLRDIRNILTYFTLKSEVSGIKLGDIMGGISTKRNGFMSLDLINGLEALDGLIEDPKVDTSVREQCKGEFGNSSKPKNSDMVDMVEYPAIALGRTVVAETMIDGKPLAFPLTFRMTPMIGSPAEVIRIFDVTKIEEGLKMRWLMRSTGELTTAEWLAGGDIVKAKFRAKDKEIMGYLKEVDDRSRKNTMAAVRTGTLNVNAEANSFIISKETARQIEVNTGNKFSNEGSRNKIFKLVAANTIVVVDGDRGVFTFYMNGMSIPDVYTRNEIKIKSKNSDVTSLDSLIKLLNGR